jgi:hypothetical protein
MANNIFHKINSHKKQTTVVKDDQLIIPGAPKIEDKVSEVNKNLGVTHSGPKAEPDAFEAAMIKDREKYGKTDMSLPDYIAWKERKNAQSGNTDFQGQEDGVNVDATNWSDQDVDYGNRTEQVVTPGQDATPDRKVVLDNEYQVNQSRVEAGKQKRREGMIDRSTKRRNNRAFRLLNKQKRKSGSLTPEQQQNYDYLKQNRYTDGIMDNYKTDSSGKITGNKLSDLSGNLNLGIGGPTKLSGGSEATLANIEAFRIKYGYNPKVVNNQIQPPNSSNESSYKMKGYSGYQENPTTPKKEKLLTQVGKAIGKVGRWLGGADDAADISKVTKKVDNVADTTTDTQKFSRTTDEWKEGDSLLPDTRNKVGEYTGGSKGLSNSTKNVMTGIGVTAGVATVGTLGLKSLKNSDNDSTENNNETTVTPPPKKTGKSYDQAYKDRDRKTYGHMNKSDYIKEAKRQNDVFKSTGKWDYKNAPKDPGPVSAIKPAKLDTKMGQTTQLNTKKVDVDLSALDTRSEVKPNVSKKQEKLGNRIGRLEGRKSTPRRERKINKLQQKQAGVDRGTIRANKVINKNLGKSYNALTEGKIGKAVRNYGKAQRHVDKPNPNVTNTLAGKEAELRKAAGFKQKGWAGFQK